MVDINYSLETLTGKHGGLLEVVEAIVSDGRLIVILTDEDVLQRRDAPLKGVFYRVVLTAGGGDYECERRSFWTCPRESQVHGGWKGIGETRSGDREISHVIKFGIFG